MSKDNITHINCFMCEFMCEKKENIPFHYALQRNSKVTKHQLKQRFFAV